MMEVSKTPEQEEMEVYEKYIEAVGADAVIEILINAIHDAERCFIVADAFGVVGKEETEGATAAKACLRETVAAMQIYLNMAELLVGDTAEEECRVLERMREIVRKAEAK